MKHRTANNLLLALTAFIWGSAFVAQSVGMDHVGPFTFNSIRSFMGGIVLLPVILILRRQSGRTNKNEKNGLLLWIGGICCGIALAAASSLQQIGLIYTSAGKAGFITAMYILIVPVMGISSGKRRG